MTLTELTAALRAAAEAAERYTDTPDDGSCNLDCAVFWPVAELPNEVIEAAAQKAGVRLAVSRWPNARRCVFVYVAHGQAARRTAMAEAAEKALAQAGLAAGMYYQVD